MPLSVYVHIPYCLQRCRYCDFTTFVQDEILPPERYVGQILAEIRNRRSLWRETEIATLYFGGGTPSLIAPELIVTICQELAKTGFTFTTDAEVTIEINPATLTPAKLETYLRAGVNRFSVGAQSFDDALLSLCGRKHSAADTRATLKMLSGLNYSFDLLFALPGQTQDGLQRDLDEVAQFSPPHLSAYCLTVPEGHPMAQGRPPEDDQVEMFARIESELATVGLLKYEISNFAKPGWESRHNGAYWSDRNYWGLGLSSHSYLRDGLGLRFWNPKRLDEYEQQVPLQGESFERLLPAQQYEKLKANEALTDFSHMFLRTMRGLSKVALHQKFPDASDLVEVRLAKLVDAGWIDVRDGHWRLTTRGQLVSNKVFEELTFLPGDVPLTQRNADPYCAV